MVAGALVQARFLCARRDHQHAMSEKERDRRAAAWKSL
jgi:hypothetical protein